MKKIIGIIFIVLIVGCSSSNNIKNDIVELDFPNEFGVITRADWGWKAPDSSYKTHSIDFITIHHGGVEFTKDENPYDAVRNLQSWSRKEKGWIDIPYHFMIDLNGEIFETRPINIPGDTNTEYDPTNHALVEVMGNYEIQELNEEQYKSLLRIVKFLANEFDVPVDKIKTHKDYSSQTVCPGKNIYKYFQDGTFLKDLEK